jgi:phage N-6-adenine-methyltransferase
MPFAQETFSSPAEGEDPRNCWRTPRALFEAVERCYGVAFDVDVAALRETSLCAAYYGPDHEAIERRDWLHATIPLGGFGCRRYAWCNPPYSQAARFLTRCAEWGEAGHMAVALVFARTDTAWWHDVVMHADHVLLLRGRVPFVPYPERPATTPSVGSALVVWGVDMVDRVVGWDWREVGP